ncbi:leucine-rich repeat-containing protein 15-like [Branchiostoma lanceolatum]|uniref:leucine-rich repeat-containing protein 15-like n=1 Tax=Branchiostoma lanceolatum TaxID=7740 RepID=UPI0034567C54
MGEKLTGMLLSLLIILKVFGSTEAACSITGSWADCRSRGLTSVPQNLPTGITRLHLLNNLITTLNQSDFSQYGSLTRLDLTHNQIATINSQAFYNLSDLIYLDLLGNHLSSLRSDMFTGLGNLQTLYLHNNEISDIQAGTFNSTPQLTDALSLSQNMLTNLRPDMFTGLGNLKDLWLSNNEISDIQAGTFSSTPHLTYLGLHQNKLTNLRSGMFTGLGNLETLRLYNNEISDIQAGTFSSTPQLRGLHLYQNKLTNLRSDMFTGLGNLHNLNFYSNEISDIQAGTFNSTPQLRWLYLSNNTLTALKAEMFTILSSISTVNIDNNPWQCDCRMVPFRQKMTGSHSFENQITCEGLSNFHGQKLKDISPEELMSDCEEPTILRFGRSDNNTVVEGETLHLVCEASGIPTPDITVILPSGLNATAESGGRVTVDVSGAITITNVTASDAGSYICTAGSFVNSTFATLVINVQLKVTTVTGSPVSSPLAMTSTLNKISSGYHESAPTVSIPLLYTSVPSKQPESAPSFPLPVLIGCVCGAVVITALLVTIILTIWHKETRSKRFHLSSNSDEEEYEDAIPLSQKPHTDNIADHKE